MARLTDEDRANLVAYLDGELDDATAQALEAKLNLDPTLRTEADSLKRTWELLDHLPRPEASPNFTHRTLERLAVRETSARAPSVARRSSWVRVAGWAAAAVVALVLGRAAGQFLLPAGPPGVHDSAEIEDQMVRHLRLLKNKHLYDAVDDLEFLWALDSPDLFGDESDS